MKNNASTKQKLLASAFALFAKQGFDRSSIQQIIKAAKVSKGAFYHYFSSKEEILEAIANEHAQQAFELIDQISRDEKLNAIEKFNLIIADLQKLRLKKGAQHKKLRQILKSEVDPKWQQKFLEKFMKATEKPFVKIFRQGVAEGLFTTKYPTEIARFYFPFALAFKQTFLLDKKNLRKKLELYEDLLTRMLGAKANSIHLAQPVLKYLNKRNHD